ncbi:glycerol-phosphate dehydrogenase [Cryptosporidium bovis]|uniref:glycerol-phosphate dehydrogenase n=1 Tax=Cryptosporidium bovis TaxID=310047 RepID=UPI003519EA17|nr:glycerol-phosphate dehydrogenase [Cryptosporidium bovis]
MCLRQHLRCSSLKVTIFGAGSFGSAISCVVGYNTERTFIFNNEVKLWLYDEKLESGESLAEVINRDHVNVKYLPDYKLPNNIRAVTDLKEACEDCNLMIFVIPSQYIRSVASQIKKLNVNFSKEVRAVSLTKGFLVENGHPYLISSIIQEELGVECCVLSGANVASGLAAREFGEATLACSDYDDAYIWQYLFDTPWFKIDCVPDVICTELFGGLKNIIALLVGMIQGLGCGTNTVSAVMRLGVLEMILYGSIFFNVRSSIMTRVFFESCGIADLVTTCLGGRNVRGGKAFTLSNGQKSWSEIETEVTGGQHLAGLVTLKEINETLEVLLIEKSIDVDKHFPLIRNCYRIAYSGTPPRTLIEILSKNELRELRFVPSGLLALIDDAPNTGEVLQRSSSTQVGALVLSKTHSSLNY